MNEKLGIVLSGGGIRGIAHIGLLQALKENGIEPDYIAGASAGALVGAMYAAGYGPEESLELFRKTPLFKWSNYNLSRGKPGLFDSEKYSKYFLNYLPENSFKALHKTLFVAVTDICEGSWKILDKGPLISSLLASSALPPVFSPVEIDGVFYADGGIMNNFPLEPLEGLCHKIIGSHASPIRKVSSESLGNSFNLIQRSYELNLHVQSFQKYNRCSYVFSPDELYPFGMLNTGELEKVYQIGYEKALEQMPAIKMALGYQEGGRMAS